MQTMSSEAKQCQEALEAVFGKGNVTHISNGRIGQKWQIALSKADQFYVLRLGGLPARVREDEKALSKTLRNKGAQLFWGRGNLLREVYLTIKTEQGAFCFELDRHSPHGPSAKGWLIGRHNYDPEHDMLDSYRGEMSTGQS